MRTICGAVLLVWGLVPAAPAATIILVRHAEQSGGMSADVPLTARGEERARELARVLRDAKIRAVFTAELRRTGQTAEPTAREFHIQPAIIPAADTDALLERLRVLPADDTVLVVGRASTIPAIVERLGGSAAPMAETEYDRMTVIVTRPNEKPAVLTLRYGAN